MKRQTSGKSSDNERQRLRTSGTLSDNEWQQVITNDKEWQRVVQRVTTSDTRSDNEWYNEWQRVTTNGNEWPRLRTVVQRMKTAQYTSKNGWLPSFQWQKEIHYYLKRRIAVIKVAAVKNYLFYITPEKWMAATASVKKSP